MPPDTERANILKGRGSHLPHDQRQEYSYTRDELVKMLDESMAKHP
jgi:hypothetical protein